MMIIYERKKLYLVLASQHPSLNSRVLPSRFIWDFLNNFSSSTLSSLCRSSSRSTARDGRVCILWLNCCLVIVPVPVGRIRKRKKGRPFWILYIQNFDANLRPKTSKSKRSFPISQKVSSFFLRPPPRWCPLYSCLRFPSFQMSVPLALCSFHIIFAIHLLQKGRPRRPTQRHDTTQPATHRANFLLHRTRHTYMSLDSCSVPVCLPSWWILNLHFKFHPNLYTALENTAFHIIWDFVS